MFVVNYKPYFEVEKNGIKSCYQSFLAYKYIPIDKSIIKN